MDTKNQLLSDVIRLYRGQRKDHTQLRRLQHMLKALQTARPTNQWPEIHSHQIEPPPA